MVTAMASPFHYQDPFPLGDDTTKYRLLTKEHVSVAEFDGKPVLKVAPEALTLLANQALHDINFYLRTEGLSAAQVCANLQQHPHNAEAAMFQLMLLHERRSKRAPQPSGTMGSGLTGSDRESIHAYVLRHPSTIVTEGGVVTNPRLPPELFQTISKTRYRDNVVVTTKGEKVCARA